MPAKSSPRDILSISILKCCVDVFAPVIARVANLSLSEGCFPSGFKMEQVSPLLKKPGLDCTDPANYRPISNLSTVSKLVKRLVLVRLRPHLLVLVNFNPLQSAYRTGHSTEMAISKILDDFCAGINNKQLSILVSLDISAAFDTICHSKLLQRLCDDFGVRGTALKWIDSYVSNHQQLLRWVNTQHRLHTVHQQYHRDLSLGGCFLLHTCSQLLTLFSVMECCFINMLTTHISMLQLKQR